MTSNPTAEQSPAQCSRRLGLHVLGGGVGESIVLELPQGGWGVIDCYAGKINDPTTNFTLQFLRRRQVLELEFVALTHPHADHFRGLLDLFDALPVRQFWRFGGLSTRELPDLMQALEQSALERSIEQRVSEGTYLKDIFRRVGDLRRSHGLQMTKMQDTAPLYPMPLGAAPAPGIAQIFSLAPLTNTVEAYQDQLHRCFDAEGRLRTVLPQINQNMISAALRVVYGETTLILGGDVERDSWEEILTSPKTDNALLASHAVKVSHHGSPTGHCAGLWALFCAGWEPMAILTPSHRHRLPTRETYDHIRAHTPHIAATCLPAVTFSAQAAHPEGIDPAARLALQAILPGFRSDQRFASGVCSFWFDDTGTLVDHEFVGAAGLL